MLQPSDRSFAGRAARVTRGHGAACIHVHGSLHPPQHPTGSPSLETVAWVGRSEPPLADHMYAYAGVGVCILQAARSLRWPIGRAASEGGPRRKKGQWDVRHRQMRAQMLQTFSPITTPPTGLLLNTPLTPKLGGLLRKSERACGQGVGVG